MKKRLIRFRNEKSATQIEPSADNADTPIDASTQESSQVETPLAPAPIMTTAEEQENALGKVDKALLIASILIWLFSVGLLFSESWFNSSDETGLAPIGLVKGSSNDVRRKVTSGLAWAPVSS